MYLLQTQANLGSGAAQEDEEGVGGNATQDSILQIPEDARQQSGGKRKQIRFFRGERDQHHIVIIQSLENSSGISQYSLFAFHMSQTLSSSTSEIMAATMMAARVAFGIK